MSGGCTTVVVTLEHSTVVGVRKLASKAEVLVNGTGIQKAMEIYQWHFLKDLTFGSSEEATEEVSTEAEKISYRDAESCNTITICKVRKCKERDGDKWNVYYTNELNNIGRKRWNE